MLCPSSPHLPICYHSHASKHSLPLIPHASLPPPPPPANPLPQVVPDYDKYNELEKLMREHKDQKTLIFCETKRGCDSLTAQMRSAGFPALALHGDKSQGERDWVLNEFKSGRHFIMLATDVAARGLGRLHRKPAVLDAVARPPALACALISMTASCLISHATSAAVW